MNTSDMKAFEEGDILVGATLLNNPEDDHAGPGRIIQFDSDLTQIKIFGPLTARTALPSK